ncbi:type I polyketide synthase [Streptomyces sp. SCSIO ZS0520]|uniref:type I polyketide synthase n=1 Tax=Streptomyces sp. SCSIO ZS0520 TaxID=2892996 RepID=UPI0021D93D7C|nr:type I polyketide synthase [Streptomyces sp. SCSIO ZS0520]UFZ14060.1 PKS I [Streptomyces sp.]
MSEDVAKLRDYLKRVTVDLRKANRRLQEVESQAREPIAIVGMGCRFAGGADSPEELWKLLAEERDAVGPLPTDRGWDLDRLLAPGTGPEAGAPVTEGAFLDDVAGFDAEFFGIAPREALAMDPQQRLLLETAWSALEHAGLDPSALEGVKAGVFVGRNYHEYGAPMIQAPESVRGHLVTGAVASVASGRVAYSLGLSGPAVTVDTACSTSLMAVHLAVQSLRSGESDLALAGGVAVMSSPGTIAEFTKQGALAADGRCKAFAAEADGMGLAEGVGVLVLERLSEARRNGHRVLAVVRGSAANQDGASNGLAAPNGPAQQRVIRAALAASGLTAKDVDAVEAHGTGTKLGDPIEAQALLATYGQGRPEDQPLWLGSVKSNVGHTQAAAGAAALIKMVQALRHGTLPKTLHAETASPHVDWESGAVRLLTASRPWPKGERLRRAAVSGFGISGTNVHILLEEAPEEEPAPAAEAPEEQQAPATEATQETAAGGAPYTVSLSAKQDSALRAYAARLHTHLTDHPELAAAQIADTMAARPRFAHRAAVIGTGRDELLAGLAAVAEDSPHSNVVTGTAREGKTVFVFPGQGSQWVGMGVQLLATSAVFAKSMEECAAALAPFTDWSLLDVLDDADALARVDVVQPATWAVMVSLARWWQDHGIQPDAVIGHSQGEIAAAHIAGALSLEDAARVVALRSQALTTLAGTGGMMSLALSAETAGELISSYGDDLHLAALNSPTSTVVAGTTEALDNLQQHCEAEGIRHRRIPVDYASHTPLVEPLRAQLASQIGELTPRQSDIPFYSTVTTEAVDTTTLTTDYWFTNLRTTVHFAPTVQKLLAHGHTHYIETSPHPGLTTAIEETADTHTQATTHATLLRGDDTPTRLHHALAHAHTHGLTPAAQPTSEPATHHPDLPTYPFQHKRYWLAPLTGATGGDEHPFIDVTTVLADGDRLAVTGRLSLRTHPWLADHAALGTVLLPGTGFVELALAVGARVGCEGIEELTLEAPLRLPATGTVEVQVLVDEPEDTGRRAVRILSRPEDTAGLPWAPWTQHATGTLVPGSAAPAAVEPGAETDLSVWPPTGAEPVEVSGLYGELAAAGLQYGPAFTGVRAAWRRGAEVFAEVALPEEAAAGAEHFGIHPALFDTALHGVGLGRFFGDGPGLDGARLPFAWSGVRLDAVGASALRVRLAPTGTDALTVTLADTTGRPVASVDSVVARPVTASQLGGTGSPADALYRLDWTPVPAPAADPSVSAPPVIRYPDDRDLVGARTLPDHAEPKNPENSENPESPENPESSGAAAGLDALVGLQGLEVLRSLPEFPRTVLLDLRPESGSTTGFEPGAAAPTATLHRALRTVRAWLADERATAVDARLVVLTRKAVAVTAAEVPCLEAAPVWGLLRSAQTEQPGRFVLVDVDEDEDKDEREDAAASAERVVGAALATGEPQLAFRGGEFRVPRLVRHRPEATEPEVSAARPVRWDPEGTVLLTGGTGTLAGLLAAHLVREHGVRHLLLASRSGPDAEGAEALREQLTALGASVRIAACDLTDREATAALLTGIGAAHPLTAVVHTAGVVDDAMVTSLTAGQLDRVLASKTTAALHLHELTRELPLDAFVLFSSAAAVLGGAGQSGYAAANAFLDALARHRRAEGLPALSMGWGLWERRSGLTGALGQADLARIARGGVAPLADEEALALFDTVCADTGPEPVLLPVRLDLAVLRTATEAPTAPVLRGLVRTPGRRTAARATAGEAGLRERLAALSGEERARAALDLVRGQAAAALGHGSADTVAPTQAFKELGFDSLMAVELRNTLATATGLRLPATLVFDHPDCQALSAFLLGEFGLTADSGASARTGVSRTAAPVRPAESGGAEEPLAIVGMACRYPGGASTPERFWELVAGGEDAIAEFPVDRGWDPAELFDPDPDRAGKSSVWSGGFLYDAADFDPAFFGLSPREALAMDPQQRLLLETAWEAVERAGIDPTSLRGSRTGVFGGVMYHDYAARVPTPPADLEPYLGNGSAGSIATGRLAYTFGFEGPAVTVDTACSSSLVALHLAGRALRSGECDLALAGGVTVMSALGAFVEFSRQRGLSADGRCKSFAAAADGTGWGEGAGMLLVERLSDARRNGHRILAVVRGTAINQDGASNGLTAPSGPAQQRVIRAALADAGLTTADVDAVEAHGTGTTLGDPIEASALLATYGQDRPEDQPLWLGSVKSNIGHTQAAAGVAGIIKMIQALRHGQLPATLHVDAPNPAVDWEAGAVRLLTQPRDWPRTDVPRRAAVSSFGASGTNAHVVLEEAPEPVSPARTTEPPASPRAEAVLWPLSARTPGALAAQAGQLTRFLDTAPRPEPATVARALATRRAAMDHRAVVLHGDPEALAALAQGTPHPHLVTGTAAQVPGKVAFLFSGQGSQHPGMGRELYDAFPLFAAALDEVATALDPELASRLTAHTSLPVVPLREVMFAGSDTEHATLLQQTAYTQPALFALEVALHHLLAHWEITPDLLLGHSLGEITAAHLAGVLDLRDAAVLVTTRATLMQAQPTGGAMTALQATEDETIASLPADGTVTIAAVNGPTETVISGDYDAVHTLAAHWASQGRKTTHLHVSHAFHSPHMDGMLDTFRNTLRTLTFHAPTTPLISNITGELATTAELSDPDYWTHHVRTTVRFHHGLTTLHTHHTTTYLELGPGHALTQLATHASQSTESTKTTALPLLRRKQPEVQSLLTALATLHTRGISPAWETLLPDSGEGRDEWVELPTYPFQRQRLWLDAPPPAAADPSGLGLVAAAHPFLGAVAELAGGEGLLFTGRLSLRTHPWLADHSVGGTVLLPGTALLELALHAAARTEAVAVAELALRAPLVLPYAGAVRIQVTVGKPDERGQRHLTVHSRPEGEHTEAPWTRHAEAVLAAPQPEEAGTAEQAPGAGGSVWPPEGARPVPAEALAGQPDEATGLSYGPSFQGLRAAWRQGAEVYAEVVLPDAALGGGEGFAVHPALLDAALQAIRHGEFLATGQDGETAFLPFSWNGARLHASGATALRVRIAPATGENAVRVEITDPAGAPVLSMERLALRPVDPEGLRALGDRSGAADALYHTEWSPLPGRSAETAPGSWAVLAAGDGSVAAEDSLIRALQAAGAQVRRIPELGAADEAAEAGADGTGSAQVVVWVRDDPEAADTAAEGTDVLLRTLETVQHWLREDGFADRRLTVLTRGAVALPGETPRPAQAPVWGLLRSAQAEHPGRFLLVDVDGQEESLRALPAAVACGEPQLAVRRGRLSVPRLAPAPNRPTGAKETAAPAPELGGGTVLITGGTGTLGALVARHLVTAHGVQHLLLAGRQGPSAPGVDELTSELVELGAQVTVASCDVSQRAELEALLATVPPEHPLTAVVHTAGGVDDALIGSLTPEAVRRVMAPKASGAWALHELTRELPLTAFVLFSSFAGTAGSPGQSGYAAANAFLDALAGHRQAAGLPALSLGWGLWEPASGITAGLSAADRARISRTGVAALSAKEALALLDAALLTGGSALSPVRLDLPVLRAKAAAGTLPPLLRHLAPAPPVRTASPAEAASDAPAQGLAERLATLPEARRRAELLDFVRSRVAAVLGHPNPVGIEAEGAFQDLGFDSLTAMELRNRIQEEAGVPLPATLIFDFPTPAAVAAELAERLGGGAAGQEEALLGELDRLEASLAAAAQGGADRSRIGARLRTLLSRWNEADAADGAPDEAMPEPEAAAGRPGLDEATDEDLFTMVEDLRNS